VLTVSCSLACVRVGEGSMQAVQQLVCEEARRKASLVSCMQPSATIRFTTASSTLHRATGDQQRIPAHARTPSTLASSRAAPPSSLQGTSLDHSREVVRYQRILRETSQEEGLFRGGSHAGSIRSRCEASEDSSCRPH